MVSEERLYQALQQNFGYSSFLSAQKGIITGLLEGKSTLAIMPTGSGKSLCFQLPALILEGITLVVSPMISLMKDQVMQLKQLGIAAAMHNSLQSSSEQEKVRRDFLAGAVKLLYVAPETLLRSSMLALLDSNPPALIAIDEAHCISMWGHDFRPEYRQLHSIRARYPQAVCFALTATAIPKVRTDICTQLGIPLENQVIESFNRPNLLLAVEPKMESYARILSFLRAHKNESGIIYCMTRKTVDSISNRLQKDGYGALPYHAGLSDEERHRNQEAFINDEVPLMVATIAFGMGINKSNIRFVIHVDLPKSLEAYYQEIGRAGRDGLPSTCLLLFSKGDLITLNRIIYTDDEALNQNTKQHLEAMISYGESYVCRRKPLLGWFGETYHEANCQMCDNCLASSSSKTDATLPAQKLLSAAYRAKEAYPIGRLIKILRGSKAKELMEAGDDKLSVYGIGKELSETNWQALYQEMKRQQVLSEGYPGFRVVLNDSSWEILRKQREFFMPESFQSIMLKPVAADSDDGLFSLLRELRREIAMEQGVPPYLIFSDKVMQDFTRYYPQSEADFLRINGVGEFKALQYGERFVNLIRDYCQEHDIKANHQPVNTDTSTTKTSLSRTEIIAQYIKEGHSIEAAANFFKVKPNTVLDYLNRYLEQGGKISANVLATQIQLNQAAISEIRTAFKEHGFERLGTTHKALNERYSYEELRLIRLLISAELDQSQG